MDWLWDWLARMQRETPPQTQQEREMAASWGLSRYVNPLLASQRPGGGYTSLQHMRGGNPLEAARWAGTGDRSKFNFSEYEDQAWRHYLAQPQTLLKESPWVPSRAQNDGVTYWHMPGFFRDNFAALYNALGDEREKQVFVENVAGPKGLVYGHATLSRGQDPEGHFLSLYDIYNFDVPGEALSPGMPFELYDRVYYDPSTGRPLR